MEGGLVFKLEKHCEGICCCHNNKKGKDWRGIIPLEDFICVINEALFFAYHELELYIGVHLLDDSMELMQDAIFFQDHEYNVLVYRIKGFY